MLNERDDKYETPEESEYHFSEDDVNYEVEPETAPPTETQPKGNILNKLTRSKRMMISLAVFLVLVFIVYRMVTPSATTTTDITMPATQVASTKPMTANPPTSGVYAPNAGVVQRPATLAQQPEAPNLVTPPSLPQNAAQLQAAPTQAATLHNTPTTYPAQATAPSTPASLPPQQVMAAQQPAIQQQQPMPAQPPMNLLPQQQNMAPQQPMMPPQQAMVSSQQQAVQTTAPMSQQTTTSLPSSNAGAVPMMTTTTGPTMAPPQMAPPSNMQIPVTNSTLAGPIPEGMEAGMAALAAKSQQEIAQFQAQYAQRINEYASQNKNLTEQMQALSTRVASMEAEMHRLLQVLTKQVSAPPPASRVESTHTTHTQIQVAPPRLPYNVQAIIPGRAWLRSDSGETVTVAEGDMLKNVGRVVKIDPYDGIVEINTGTKVVSLSYGTSN